MKFREAVERVTGRTVRAFVSGMDVDEDVSCELFYLEPTDKLPVADCRWHEALTAAGAVGEKHPRGQVRTRRPMTSATTGRLVPVMRESAYFRALQTALYGAGLPYGYAVTVWSSGAALAGEHGMPTKAEIFLFALGAMSAYGGLTLSTGSTGGEAEKPLSRSPHLVRAGVVHLAAIAAAITAALLLAQIRGSAAWLLTTFAATVLYLCVSSVEVAAVERGRGTPASGD